MVREELCIGCGLCRVYCEAHLAGNDDPWKALKKRTVPPAGGIRIEQSGPLSVSVRCQHCEEPACVDACLTGAMHRRDDGAVLIDSEKCIGCGTCMLVCPYGAISKDPLTGKAVKCDGCLDREIPRCVSVCPNGALVVVDDVAVPAIQAATGSRRHSLV
ncbi:MAG: 4Fe-4S dicluster domain-containing protein [Dehalococcoidia bacterium]|nr:4Fe-4S dicluster domain-containing protein [Dehalococcoidia bacterium]